MLATPALYVAKGVPKIAICDNSRIKRDFAGVWVFMLARYMTKNVIFDLFEGIYATFLVTRGAFTGKIAIRNSLRRAKRNPC